MKRAFLAVSTAVLLVLSLAAGGENPYYLEMLDFARCIRENAHPRCCCHVAEASDIACLMCNAALRQKRHITLPPEIYQTAGACPNQEA